MKRKKVKNRFIYSNFCVLNKNTAKDTKYIDIYLTINGVIYNIIWDSQLY